VPWDLRALESEVEHNKAINQINIAEMRKVTDTEAAAVIATEVLRIGEEQGDFRLQASGHRILGEVAELKAWKLIGPRGAEMEWWQEMERAQNHFRRALILYGRSELSTPQVVAATKNSLLSVQLNLSQQQWIRDGRPDGYPAAERVPENIVFRDHPWLRDMEQSARDIPSKQDGTITFLPQYVGRCRLEGPLV